MEAIINFLEQYWGYTIFGGLSLGTISTFIITNIKTLIQNKAKNINIDNVVNKANELCIELTGKNAEQAAQITKLETLVRKQNQDMAERNEYFEKIQTATFQAISYLTIASKLPTEDKIALQQKFASIVQNKAVEYKEVLKDEVQAVKTEVETKVIPDAKETIENTIEETKSLLDKYTKEA